MPSHQENLGREGKYEEARIAVTYVHPPMGCPNDGTRETRHFSAKGRNKKQAEGSALDQAKKEPPICPLCGTWYEMKIVLTLKF